MARDFVVAFLAFMAVLLMGQEGWHSRDDIVVVVVMVKVQAFICIGTRINHSI